MPVSILSCNLDRETPDLATIKAPGLLGSDGTYGGSYKLKYNIMMASISGPRNVCTQGLTGSPNPLPSLWGTYSYQGDTDPHSYAKSYSVARDPKAAARYYVTVNFEPAEPGEIPPGGGTPIKAEPNPVNRAPYIWFDREVFSHVDAIETHDPSAAAADRKTLLTHANTLYDELVEQDRTRAIMVVEFAVATLTDVINLTRRFDQSVNDDTWDFRAETYPARTVLVREISGTLVRSEGAYTYCPVVMRLAFANQGQTWDVPLPEMSQTHFVKDSSSDYTMLGGFRKRVDAGSLVPINSDGTRRSDDDPVLITDWRIRREVNFGDLPFA